MVAKICSSNYKLKLTSSGTYPWGRKESDTTERLRFHFSLSSLEKEMATHSSVLAWRIPGTGGALWASVYGVAQSRTRQKRLSSSSSSLYMESKMNLFKKRKDIEKKFIHMLWFSH